MIPPLYQIKAPHFCAGFILNSDGTVEIASPIISYMKNWPLYKVTDYCKKKEWALEFVS